MLEEGIRNVKTFITIIMMKINVEAQVPDGGKPMKWGFHSPATITAPILKARLISKLSIP